MIEKMMRFYMLYIPKNYVVFLFAIWFLLNGSFWLYEDFTNIEHKVYWFDVVLMMALVSLLIIIFSIEKLSENKYSIHRYNEVEDVIKNSDIVLIFKNEK